MSHDEVINALKHLIGTRYDFSMSAEIRDVLGHDKYRVEAPGTVPTSDFDPERLRILTDGEQVVALRFG